MLAPADGTRLLLPRDVVEAQGGQPGEQRAPLSLRDAVPEAAAVEQVVSHSSDGRVAAVLGSQQDRLVALGSLNEEK